MISCPLFPDTFVGDDDGTLKVDELILDCSVVIPVELTLFRLCEFMMLDVGRTDSDKTPELVIIDTLELEVCWLPSAVLVSIGLLSVILWDRAGSPDAEVMVESGPEEVAKRVDT
jgi:hypothetical protein